MYIFWGPKWVGGARYDIFLIREKPALRSALIILSIVSNNIRDDSSEAASQPIQYIQ